MIPWLLGIFTWTFISFSKVLMIRFVCDCMFCLCVLCVTYGMTFVQRKITRLFDLKGSSRSRYLEVTGQKTECFDEALLKRRRARRTKTEVPKRNEPIQVLMDDNLMELTRGWPFPLKHRAKIYYSKAVTNDTLFLSMVDVVDYSMIVGFDEDTHEIVVGIIDYMRKVSRTFWVYVP
jgi:Phosphatidylinositol-4-phosphate 5-Kinase